jgi:hypothetical protein
MDHSTAIEVNGRRYWGPKAQIGDFLKLIQTYPNEPIEPEKVEPVAEKAPAKKTGKKKKK